MPDDLPFMSIKEDLMGQRGLSFEEALSVIFRMIQSYNKQVDIEVAPDDIDIVDLPKYLEVYPERGE